MLMEYMAGELDAWDRRARICRRVASYTNASPEVRYAERVVEACKLFHDLRDTAAYGVRQYLDRDRAFDNIVRPIDMRAPGVKHRIIYQIIDIKYPDVPTHLYLDYNNLELRGALYNVAERAERRH